MAAFKPDDLVKHRDRAQPMRVRCTVAQAHDDMIKSLELGPLTEPAPSEYDEDDDAAVETAYVCYWLNERGEELEATFFESELEPA